MIRVQQSNVDKVQSLENQTSAAETATSQTQSKLGLAETRDSFDTKPNESSAIRQIVQAAKAEGKIPMTQNNLNRYIQNNLKPEQYIATFRDLNGWVSKNFYLTPTQKAELNSLSQQDIGRMQDASAIAAQFDKPISVSFLNPNPDSIQPKKLVLGNVSFAQKVMSATGFNDPATKLSNEKVSENPMQDGSTFRTAEDQRKDLQEKAKQAEEKIKELREQLDEVGKEKDNTKPVYIVIGQDDPTVALKQVDNGSQDSFPK